MKYGIAAVIVCLIYWAMAVVSHFALRCTSQTSSSRTVVCSGVMVILNLTCVLSLVLSVIAAFT